MGLLQDVLDDGFSGLQHNFITGKLEDLVRWSRSRSSWSWCNMTWKHLSVVIPFVFRQWFVNIIPLI